MEAIELKGRYGLCHKLEHVSGDCWKLVPDPKNNYVRYIGFDGQKHFGTKIMAIDPEGGPMLSVGDIIKNYTIESITTSGFIWLKENKNENS